MPAGTRLNIPLDQLIAALGQFQELQTEAEAVRANVAGGLDGLGASWYGKSRNIFNDEIMVWMEDYRRMVEQPLEALLNWFRNNIAIMQQVDDTY